MKKLLALLMALVMVGGTTSMIATPTEVHAIEKVSGHYYCEDKGDQEEITGMDQCQWVEDEIGSHYIKCKKHGKMVGLFETWGGQGESMTYIAHSYPEFEAPDDPEWIDECNIEKCKEARQAAKDGKYYCEDGNHFVSAEGCQWETKTADQITGETIEAHFLNCNKDKEGATMGIAPVSVYVPKDRTWILKGHVAGDKEVKPEDPSCSDCPLCDKVEPATPSGDDTEAVTIKGTKIKKLTGAKKAFYVKWKKSTSANATGYQVRYSTKSSMAKAKIKTVKGYKKQNKKIKKLKAKKRYYVQVRTYKTVSGKTYYSKWSAKKSVKTK